MRHHLFRIPFHALLLAGLLPSASVLAEQTDTPPSASSALPAAEAKTVPENPAPASTPSLAPAPAFLGVETVPVDVATGQNHKLAVGTGLRVRAVAPDSPAFGLLQPDDILVLLDQQILCNPDQLRTLIRAKKSGDNITLSIHRDGDPVRVEVQLGNLPANLRDARPLRENLSPLREYFGDLERQLRLRGEAIVTDADTFAEIAENIPDEIREHLREVEKDLRQHRERLQDKAGKGYDDVKKTSNPALKIC
jgi:hypothetical protein